jgi:hypothetical protein
VNTRCARSCGGPSLVVATRFDADGERYEDVYPCGCDISECPVCTGTGGGLDGWAGPWVPCGACGGTGRVRVAVAS